MESSISLSVGENSVRIKEKPKAAREAERLSIEKDGPDRWWLKRPETRLGVLSAKNADVRTKQSPLPPSEVSSSMKEFLERERMCKVIASAATSRGETLFSLRRAIFLTASIAYRF